MDLQAWRLFPFGISPGFWCSVAEVLKAATGFQLLASGARQKPLSSRKPMAAGVRFPAFAAGKRRRVIGRLLKGAKSADEILRLSEVVPVQLSCQVYSSDSLAPLVEFA